MAAAFKWANGSDNANANTGTSVVVGTTNAVTTNGAVAAGDLLVVAVQVAWATPANASVISLSDGTYTSAYNNADTTTGMSIGVWYKIAASGDTGNPTATWTNAAFEASHAVANFSGITVTSPVDAAAGQDNTGFSTDMTAPSISLATANDLLICVWGAFGGKSPYTAPASMVTRFDVGTTSSGRAEILIASQDLTATGATGTRVATQTNADNSYGVSMAFKVIVSGASGAGTSAGTGAAAAVGQRILAGVGSVTGAGSASGTGQATDAAVGSAAGVGLVSGVSPTIMTGVGSGAGVGAAIATGGATVSRVGSAAGVGAAAGFSPSTITGVGSASGTSTASGANAAASSAVGESHGGGDFSADFSADFLVNPNLDIAVGVAQHWSATGTAAGIAAVSGIGAGGTGSVATSIGHGAANGIGGSIVAEVGTAAGVGNAAGVGRTTLPGEAIGTAFGVSSVTAVSSSAGRAIGTSYGGGEFSGDDFSPVDFPAASDRAVGASSAAADGLAVGSSDASAVGQGIGLRSGTGTAAGTGSVSGVAFVYEFPPGPTPLVFGLTFGVHPGEVTHFEFSHEFSPDYFLAPPRPFGAGSLMFNRKPFTRRPIETVVTGQTIVGQFSSDFTADFLVDMAA